MRRTRRGSAVNEGGAGNGRGNGDGSRDEGRDGDSRSMLMRLRPRGLRWRLAGWVAFAVLLSSGVTFAIVYFGTSSATDGSGDRDFSSDIRTYLLAGALVLAGTLLGAYLVGSRASRPLRRMAALVSRVNAGELHHRIHTTAGEPEEIRVLADAFNHMLDRLTDAFAGQRAFVADASHELRTPLTVIRGQLELLASQEHPSPQEVRRVESLLQSEVARISRLVDDLLLLAKAEQTQFLRIQPIALLGYVGELWDGVSLLASRRFELGPVPAGTLRADPDRLAQALRNLIANAIDHTAPERGLVRLLVEPLPGGVRGPSRASGSGVSSVSEVPGGSGWSAGMDGGGWLRFVVEDDGPGIPSAQRERIFDRFYRTDSARDRASGGTGLGLAIVRAIAEAHGGRVAAGRSPEGGARIEIELPRFAVSGDGAAPGARAPQRLSAPSPSVP